MDKLPAFNMALMHSSNWFAYAEKMVKDDAWRLRQIARYEACIAHDEICKEHQTGWQFDHTVTRIKCWKGEIAALKEGRPYAGYGRGGVKFNHPLRRSERIRKRKAEDD